MAPLHRRSVMAGIAAAPISAKATGAGAADPVEQSARHWIAQRRTADGLLTKWARLEDALYRMRGDISPEQALRSELPAARDMRKIDRQYDRLARELERGADAIVKIRALSRIGGLLKIEMALTTLDPSELKDFPWALVKSGFEDLSALI